MRLPRLAVPGLAQHVVIRGNNSQSIFHVDHDYRMCLGYIEYAAEKYQCAIHSYVLMPNHIHMLVTPQTEKGVGKLIQLVARQYVQYFNNQYHRTGTLWEGRYKSALVESDQYALECYRYIERNPLRAGLVISPADYPWSSYRCNALGIKDELVAECDAYTLLGGDAEQRQSRYQLMCNKEVDLTTLTNIRQETNRSRVLGSPRFKRKIETLLGVDLNIKPRGGDRRSRTYQDTTRLS